MDDNNNNRVIRASYFMTQFDRQIGVPTIILHIMGVYGLYLAITGQSSWKTVVYFLLTFHLGGLSITVGAHRLFTHRSYDANRGLRIFLLFLFNYTAQFSMFKWVKHHRVHHKFSDTTADPHDSNRGFFYSHIGWIFLKKTQEFKEKAKTIDVSDLKDDPDVMFQHNNYLALFLLHWSMAIIIPCYLWNETLINSACTLSLGFLVILNHAATINSVCHGWGWKPYEIGIEPTFHRIATYLSNGEGYHNFHHTFPKDYSASEHKWTENYNTSTLIIDLFEYFGWVTNKRVADPQLIQKRRLRTGDLSVKVKPRWSVVFDYILGLCVCYSDLWVTLGLRFIFSLFHLSSKV